MTSKSFPASTPAGVGAVLNVIREIGGTTRTELAEVTGLSRSALADRLEALMESQLVRETGATPRERGRPRGTVEFNPSSGTLLVAEVGVSEAVLALLDLAPSALAEHTEPIAVADGPSSVLEAVDAGFARLLRLAGRRREDVRGIGVGVPGPVSFSTGRPVDPPLMPGWHEFPVRDWFARRYGVTVLVDNDVNVMALGEQRTWLDDCMHVLFVNVGAGIGCGIVAERQILRGADGAAGGIGHIRVTGRDDARCDCGNVGCLQAVASGTAIAARLAQAGRDAAGSTDVVRLVRVGDPLANRLLRDAGRSLGEVLALCVSLFNPGVIVLGGPLLKATQPLLAGVREATIRRAPPLATRHLRIVASRLGERAGVVGAGRLLCEQLFAPEAVEELLGTHTGRRAASHH
jgi:predicted NBD/HSP70 family sugar kinase